MASLNTLRTKFGYVLSAIIAFALLAFIFSLKSDMGFSNNDPKVGEINSEDVLYAEYYAEYQRVRSQSGMTESTEQEAATLANAAWQSMISKKLIQPGLEQLGFSLSEAERMAVINGEITTQTFSSAFTDPTTGQYNSAYIANFLSQASMNPEAEAAWAQLNDQAREERAIVKLSALARAGAYANKLEVAQGVASANNSYSGQWVSKPYSSIPDSLVSISDAEIKKYYEQNKAMFKKSPNRSISYVTFEFDPTEQDIIDIENKALSVGKEFEAADDIKQYIRGNVNGSISNNYMSVAQLGEDQSKAIAAGEMYGPVNSNNVWTMSRAVSSILVPDSIGVRHIVLSYDQNALADSLLTTLKGGDDFAQAAQMYSMYAQTAQAGGEVGVIPFSSFTDEFVTALAPAKKGDIVKITSGDMIQLVEVYRADRPVAHYQVATVEFPVEPSQATIGALHSSAGMFSMAAAGSVEKFNASADEQDVVVRSATITNGDRSVRAITDSREIARWAYGAKQGDLSEVFKTDNGYVVAMLTAVDDNEYLPLANVSTSIRSILLRDKKFDKVASTLAGSSLEQIAAVADSDVQTFEDVSFTTPYIVGLGVEPKVVGAITLSGATGVSAPIKGNAAIYVVSVDPAVTTENQTAEMERARAQAVVEDRTSQYIFNAIQEMANIKDLRGEFF
ncbi:MAG: SurA N-terminal domain-containing protein [Rikenellaceae bacterium]